MLIDCRQCVGRIHFWTGKWPLSFIDALASIIKNINVTNLNPIEDEGWRADGRQCNTVDLVSCDRYKNEGCVPSRVSLKCQSFSIQFSMWINLNQLAIASIRCSQYIYIYGWVTIRFKVVEMFFFVCLYYLFQYGTTCQSYHCESQYVRSNRIDPTWSSLIWYWYFSLIYYAKGDMLSNKVISSNETDSFTAANCCNGCKTIFVVHPSKWATN